MSDTQSGNTAAEIVKWIVLGAISFLLGKKIKDKYGNEKKS